ncbi:DNA gyrase inhibitor YacG [Plastorhodobacter daqingensis]|uniref:DNA gyrase inhibitor YacG n=1 Tax=Plastorhodobacter daqingensis TaxID=1387281 RepID=A0ABW2UP81_9RHOB
MTCPICGRETVPTYRPFCSRRCADVDLGRWMSGSYVVPGDAEAEPETLDEARDEGSSRH